MKVTLTERFIGQVKAVVSLGIAEDTSNSDFLNELVTTDPELAKKLQTAMATISNEEHYCNVEKFKPLGDGLYEIKAKGKKRALRIYAFLDTIEGLPRPQVIIANYCTYKPSKKKKQDQHIKTAKAIKENFFNLKAVKSTKWEYKQPDQENEHQNHQG